MTIAHQPARATYLNPVYDRRSPDPFVLKFRGEYWCYCSGRWHDGRYFGILHSRDLINWRELDGALEPLPRDATKYWAPEVAYWNGRFYMYYSVGNETLMELRVAVAEDPAGPFIDSGHRLTREDFAIDAHVFEDDDGAAYLFYATDFLQHSHIGTGTVCDRLLDPFTLAGQPRPVTRACFDWQVYDPHRTEKGGVRWHTVEGPFVLKHKGRYHQMFSGGNWHNISYGVGDAISDTIEAADEWEQVCDGERVLPIIRTIPGKVIGPGHNSVVRGPDNQQLFCLYHRWAADGSGRLLAIDRLDWAGDRLLVLGPSFTPRPAPIAPTIEGFGEQAETTWRYASGAWTVEDSAIKQTSDVALAEARCAVPVSCFVAEVSLQALESGGDTADEPASFGVGLYDEEGASLHFMLQPTRGCAVVSERDGDDWTDQELRLPSQFSPDAFHLLRVTVDGQRVSVTLDGLAARWQGRIERCVSGITLYTEHQAAEFAAFQLTVGWQDLFMEQEASPAELGWHAANHRDAWSISERRLRCNNRSDSSAVLTKGPLLDSYELVVNARLVEGDGFGLYPACGPDDDGPLLTIARHDEGWALITSGSTNGEHFNLPDSFDPASDQQFRFRKQDGRLTIQHEAEELGAIAVSRAPTRIGLVVRRAVADFDTVRVTALVADLSVRGEINRSGN